MTARLRTRRSATTLFVAVTLASSGAAQERADDGARLEHFEARIRPVLVEHCYSCHNSSKRARGGLALDHRSAARAASDSGVAIVPGDPQASLLLRVLRHEIEGSEMPEDGPRLAGDVVRDFERWIADGAFDPRDAPPSRDELASLTSWEATLARRSSWWSLQPIRSPEPPPSYGWSEHPVDRFILRELERQNLAPAPPADRRTLIRRLSFALTGLPPTLDEIEAFDADAEPGATERLVDRLLDSPRYGERWARHWMDLVRYADSHGSEGDPAIPNAYRYRDYLIRAFNADVPYDQLVREHVAGDLLDEPRVNEELGIVESSIGAAHWRFVFHGFAPTDALDEKVRFTDDQINVFGKTFLAQTISCARCHDHKFDAISQADYFALYGILASCRPGVLDVNTPERKARHRAELRSLKDAIRDALASAWGARDVAELAARASAADAAGDADHPLYVLEAVDDALAAGLSFVEAWREASTAPEASAAETGREGERRFDLTTRDGWVDWFPTGNGLRDGPAPAGGFAIEPEGERVVTGIYPSGTYTHQLSTRHRGALQSARFTLEGEREVWFHASGDGGAKLRYVVHDYPRRGTVYPVADIKSRWAWHRLDLSYWDGDSVYLSLFTGRDTPVEVGGTERSWFGVREVVVAPKGSGEPAAPWAPAGLALVRDVGEPATRDELVARIGAAINAAVEAWRTNASSDGQALFLDALLRHGLLANTLEELEDVRPLVERYRALEREIPLPTRVPGLLEADSKDHPLFVRGDHRRPGGVVPRRFLEALDPTPYRTAASGRAELAEDLVRDDNPLTARVIANRIWHYLFGRGLVATPDNFGQLGAEPSHPELLDYLATRMVQRGWSIKDTIRFLVTSKTWQLASTPAPEARARDPENVWLSHARVRRLDAEALRDSLFAAAGTLDGTMYGPGAGAGSDAPRRGVYVQSRRNSLDGFLQAFDSPVPFATVGARMTTNVPAQSLALLNGSLVRKLADDWARALSADWGLVPEGARIAEMFEVVTGREATRAEVAAIEDYARTTQATLAREAQRRSELAGELARIEAECDALIAPVRQRLVAAAEANGTASGPSPIARWDFRAGLDDTIGDLHAVLHGTARLAEGGLLLDGDGHASTPPLPRAVGPKTLEAWLTIADADQRGGGVITLQDLRGDVFDAIVYGERIPRRWLAGSNHFARTEDFGGVDEDVARIEPVHVAITYDEAGEIRGYRNGAPYGEPYTKGSPAGFRADDAQVLFGLRHGSPSPGRMLSGVVFEARLYDRALSSEEIAASAAGGVFVSRADVLAALDERSRRELVGHEAALAERARELESLGEPPAEHETWSRVAHALFNLKEALYIR